MSYDVRSILCISFLVIACVGAMPLHADEIEIDPDGLTSGGCSAIDGVTSCVEEPGDGPEASPFVQIRALLSAWFESLRARVCGWLCR